MAENNFSRGRDWFIKKWLGHSPVQQGLIGQSPQVLNEFRKRMLISSRLVGVTEIPIQPTKDLTVFGYILNEVSRVQQIRADLTEKAEKMLREYKFVNGFNPTAWQEHQTGATSEIEKGLLKPQKGSFAFNFVFVTKDPEEIEATQNRVVAQTLFETYKDVGKTGREKDILKAKVLPTQRMELERDSKGNVTDVNSKMELMGTPIVVRVLRGNPPVDYVDIEFKEVQSGAESSFTFSRGANLMDDDKLEFHETALSSNFARFDFPAIIRGEPLPFTGVNIDNVRVSEPQPLENWYKRPDESSHEAQAMEYKIPNVVVGVGTQDFHLENFTAGFEHDLMIELQVPVGRAGGIGVIANHHLPRNGAFFIGSDDSVFERVMRNESIKKRLDNSKEAWDLGREYMAEMGGFEPQVAPIFSYLHDKFVSVWGDNRQQIEEWLALNNFQNIDSARFAQWVGAHRVQMNFELDSILNRVMVEIPRKEKFKDKLKGTVFPALAAFLTNSRMVGIDVETEGGKGLDMAPVGLPILEAVYQAVRLKKDGARDRYALARKSLVEASEYITKYLDQVKRGELPGAAGTNQRNGILKSLESWAEDGGAQIVPGVLRVGEHFSKIISKKLTSVFATFRTAMAADGTGVGFAQLNNLMNYEATLDDLHTSFELLLPVLRGNLNLKYGLIDYLEAYDGFDGRKAKVTEKKKKIIEMLNSYEEYQCFTDLDRAVTKPNTLSEIWEGRYAERKRAMAGDAKMRKSDRAQIRDLVKVFNAYVEKMIKEPAFPSGSREEQIQQTINTLNNGGWEKILKQYAKYNVSKFKSKLVEVVEIYAEAANDRKEALEADKLESLYAENQPHQNTDITLLKLQGETYNKDLEIQYRELWKLMKMEDVV